MKRYKIPDNIKEIAINDEEQLVYLKKELIELEPYYWTIAASWELLEEIGNA
jgi:hypothetical protein